MISKTSKLGIWAATTVIAAGVLLSVPSAVIAQVPVIGSLVQGLNAHFGNLVAGANGLSLAPWSNEGFTQGSWLSFNNNGGSSGETDFINYGPSLTGGFDWFAPNTSSLGSSIMHLSRAGTLTVAQVAGNAATATTAASATTASALAGSPTQCPNGATGIAANGNAVCISTTYKIQGLAITTGICTTSGAETKCPVSAATWPSAFADSSYQATCTYAGSPTGSASNPGLYGPYVIAQTASTITLQIQSGSSSAGGNNTVAGISCIGVHN